MKECDFDYEAFDLKYSYTPDQAINFSDMSDMSELDELYIDYRKEQM